MKTDYIRKNLDLLIPNPKCELIYHKDYELLIAVMLSAQCTDKRVNMVTSKLFKKYTLNDLAEINLPKLEKEIKSLGSYTKKAFYLKQIAQNILLECGGKVPNNREYLESLPGVGRKTCNVVLAELFGVPTFAVDTHVMRVSKRLNLVSPEADVLTIEKKLMKVFNRSEWNRVNHQFVLFGRYFCTAKSPKCCDCPFVKMCVEKEKTSCK